jgi:DNA-binding response OmpR family regulator
MILNQLEGLPDVIVTIQRIRQHSREKLIYYGRSTQEEQIETALQVGADQFVVAELSKRLAELVVRDLHRQIQGPNHQAVIRCGPLEIDTQGYQVRADGERILLTLTEFKILAFLARNPSRVVDRDELLSSLSSGEYVMARRMIDYHVLGLRRRLGRHRDMVKTVRGVGYQLRCA